MRIVLDARISRGWATGVGRYTINLLDGLSAHGDVDCVALINAGVSPPPVAAGSRFEFTRSNAGIASAAQHLQLPAVIRSLKPDVVFVTHPLAVGVVPAAPTVAAVLDLYPLHFPEQYPRGVALYYRTVFRIAARRCRHLIAISSATKEDVIKRLGVRPERVTVTPLAPPETFRPVVSSPERGEVLQRYQIDRPYVLYHGNKRAHKNVVGLIRAFKRVLELHPSRGLRLVITGREDPNDRENDFRGIRAEITRLGLGPDVVLTGFVADEDLPAMYSGAVVTAIPSFMEGFGLPAIESMACGTPVVASLSGSLPEVIGDAGLLVNAADIESLAQALASVVNDADLREDLSKRGLERARLFTWDSTVAATLSVLRRAATRLR